MAKMKHMRWSLSSAFPLFTVAVILFQSLLLIGALILGGVLQQSRNNTYASFHDKVHNRANYIQSEINNHWTAIDVYVHALSNKISKLSPTASMKETEQFLFETTDILIPMLRTTGTTGCFLILDHVQKEDPIYHSIYFRDYDPQTYGGSNDDLYLVIGPNDIARQLQIPMDRTWRYSIQLNEENKDFYQKPYDAASLSNDFKELAYWSNPFHLSSYDEPIITYSVPLFDANGVLRGVMGIELSMEYLKTLFPSNEISPRESLGYMIAEVDETNRLLPLVSKGGYQQRIVKNQESIQLHVKSEQHDIYELEARDTDSDIYCCVQSFSFYNRNTPYEAKNWNLVGLIQEDTLFEFVRSLEKILLFSFLASLLLGTSTMVLMTRKLTKPIIGLSQQVQHFDFSKDIKLGRTGLAEIDELLHAIESYNSKLMESTLRLSQIIDMLNVQVGVFEYKKGDAKTILTKQVFAILDLPKTEQNDTFIDSQTFLNRLGEIRKSKAPEDQDVFLSHQDPEKWVRIHIESNEDSCLGIVYDITNEILEKQRILLERDFDSLTKLYNQAAFRKNVCQRLEQPNLGVAALVMLDLDYLKLINDTYGHDYGDIYIQEAALRMSMLAADHTVTGRRSGDEFYIFFYGFKNPEEVRVLMKNFYQDLDEHLLTFPNGVTIKIKISSGISWYGKDAHTFEELGKHADLAMYSVKKTYKGELAEYRREFELEQ